MRIKNIDVLRRIALFWMLCFVSIGVANASDYESRIVEISECEFNRAYLQRHRNQIEIDTIASLEICKMVCDSTLERLGKMDEVESIRYPFCSTDNDVSSVLRFPFGFVASCVRTIHEGCEYWFFCGDDCRFVAQTGALVKMSEVHHCVSKAGYFVAWYDHSYDSNVDIFVYRVRDGGVGVISKYMDVEISKWERVCWGENNTFYVSGEYTEDIDYSFLTDCTGRKYLKFIVSQQ